MHAAITAPGSASTILTHVFACGLAYERYVVERYKAPADGDIRRWPREPVRPEPQEFGRGVRETGPGTTWSNRFAGDR